MNKENRKKGCKGAMTIEATYLCVIIFCLVIICVFAIIYVYDVALARGSAYRVALNGSRMYDRSDQEIQEGLQKMAYEYVNEKGVIWEYTPEVKVTAGKIEVSYRINVRAPVAQFMSRYLLPFDNEIVVCESARRINPVRCIQTMKFLKERVQNE